MACGEMVGEAFGPDFDQTSGPNLRQLMNQMEFEGRSTCTMPPMDKDLKADRVGGSLL